MENTCFCGRGRPNCVWLFSAAVLVFLTAAQAPALRAQQTSDVAKAVPQPWPPVLQVFKDTFNSPDTYARYSGMSGSAVSIGAGSLLVSAGTNSTGAALRMRLPPDGTGVRCLGIEGLSFDRLSGPMVWTVWGFDLSGRVVNLLDLEITESVARLAGAKAEQDQLKVVGMKNGRPVFIEVKTGKKAKDIDRIQFDTKDNGTKIQAEVRFKDGTWVFSDWVDPEAGTLAGIDVTGGGEQFSVDTTGGTQVHAEGGDLDQPAPISKFDQAVLTAMEPHWLIQTHDADAIVVATLERVGGVRQMLVDSEAGLRVRAVYRLDRVLFGSAGDGPAVVYHAIASRSERDRFVPGQRVILFLKRNPEYQSRRWFWDFGPSPRVLESSEINTEAVISRVAFIHAGGRP